MPKPRSVRRAIIVRQAGQAQAPLPGHTPVLPEASGGAPVVTQSALDAARRIGESVIVAAVTSAGLYLVGSVYADSYYSRLSIEPTSLDLPPPYVALQATHALKALLDYPTTLLVFYVLYRTFAPQLHRLQGWFDRVRQRFPRLLLILANIVVVSPLLIGALQASMQEQTLIPDSVRAEVASGLEDAGLLLLVYVIWLGWSQRAFILTEVRARKLIPIALIFTVYLLNALSATAKSAELAAELLMTGYSDASLAISFTMRPGNGAFLAGKELIFVTDRYDNYYVVERQPIPPSQRPTSYMIPGETVEVATVRRLNDADATFEDLGPGLDAMDRLEP